VDTFVKLRELAQKTKFIFPALLTLTLFILLIYAFLLPRSRRICITQEQEFVEQIVNSAVIILEAFNQKIQNGELTAEEAKAEAADLLRKLRHGDESMNYYWIIDTTPTVIMHPYRPELEERNVADYQDRNGVYVFTEMVQVTEKRGEGYVSYLWQYHDRPDKLESKRSFVKEFEPWQWIVGSGLYVDVTYREIGTLTRSMTIASAAVFLLITLFSLYLMRLGMFFEKRQYEMSDALFESESKYKALVEFMNEGLAIEDPDRKLTYVNRRFCEMIGYSKKELLGSRTEAFLDSSNREVFKREQIARRSGRKAVYELVWQQKNGGELETLISPQPIFSREGAFRGSFAVITDISQRKRIEKELKESLQEKDSLLKEVHHRVKNNLQLVVSLLSLQMDHLENDDLVATLSNSQNRIQTIAHVHELLYQSESFTRVDMHALFQAITQNEQSINPQDAKEIEFQFQIDDTQQEVLYAIPCGLIANELVSNAVKYAFRGVAHKKIIKIEFRREVDYYHLAVADNGIGLPEGFDRQQDGKFGLLLVNTLVEQLRGRLEIISNQSGSHFTVIYQSHPATE